MGVFNAAVLALSVFAVVLLDSVAAIKPSEIAAQIRPTDASITLEGGLSLVTYSVFSYYDHIDEPAKAARAGKLLKKVAKQSGPKGFTELLKQLGKKHGATAKAFFRDFGQNVASEGDAQKLLVRAAETELQILDTPSDPVLHIARAVYRGLACIRLKDDFSCFHTLQSLATEMSLAMELVHYRAREELWTSEPTAERFAAATKWVPVAEDFIDTVSAVASEIQTGIQALRGYIWQRSQGYHGMIASAWQAPTDFATSSAARSTCCSAAADVAHINKRLDKSLVNAALSLCEQYSVIVNTRDRSREAAIFLRQITPAVESVALG